MGMTYIYPPVTVSTLPPVGGATSANQLLEIAELTNIFNELTTGNNESNTNQLVIIARLDSILAELKRAMSSTIYFDYSVSNVSNSGWVEMIAATTEDTKSLTIFESGGYPMEIGIGGIGAETRLFVIPAGGLNGQIEIPIPTGSRVSIRGLQAVTVSEGYIIANFLK